MRLAKVASVFSLLCMFMAAFSSISAQTYIKTTLYEFHTTRGGPLAGLIMDSKGNLYGTGVGLGTSYGSVFRLAPNGREVEYDFKGSPDGAWPRASLFRDSTGNLYGTTGAGGRTSSNFTSGGGTIFKISSTGRETVVHKFCSQNYCADGVYPHAELVSDASGNLYSTTVEGGLRSNFGGWGVIFKLSRTTGYTVLHDFINDGADGSYPSGSLLFDSAGNAYGGTSGGGTGTACDNLISTGCGTIYKMDTAGKVTILYSFTAAPDGSAPGGTLIMDSNGVLYGTTGSGGISGLCQPYGCGTVFKFDPATGQESILYSFDGTTGQWPSSKLVMDSAGNLYGTASYGGGGGIGFSQCALDNGCGVAYQISAAGVFSVLYAFQGGSDGYGAEGLMMDAAGNLYGTTQGGGDLTCAVYGCGTVFKLTPQ